MINFTEVKSNKARLTQKQISKQLSCSDSTTKRCRDVIHRNSSFNRNKYRKTNNKSNTSITQSQTHTTNENTKNYKNTRSNEKNGLIGGSILGKNHQKENTKFLRIARKVVDNV